MKSFKYEVTGIGEAPGHYVSNALRFATKSEAEGYGFDLLLRWTWPSDGRAAESGDPVTHRWDAERGLVSIERLPSG